MINCNKCKEEKEDNMFHKNKLICIECNKETYKKRIDNIKNEKMKLIENLEDEEWKQIEYDNRYYVSNKGRIKSSITCKILNIKPSKNGYLYLKLKDNKKYLLHRLVVEHFIDKIPDDLVVDHIDRNKLNNNYTNLRIVDVSTNNKNKNVEGCVCLCNDKRLNRVYTYYRVYYPILINNIVTNYSKRFKNKEDADEHLKFLQIEYKR